MLALRTSRFNLTVLLDFCWAIDLSYYMGIMKTIGFPRNGEYYGEQVCDKETNFLFLILSASEQQPSLGFEDHGQQKKQSARDAVLPQTLR